MGAAPLLVCACPFRGCRHDRRRCGCSVACGCCPHLFSFFLFLLFALVLLQGRVLFALGRSLRRAWCASCAARWAAAFSAFSLPSACVSAAHLPLLSLYLPCCSLRPSPCRPAQRQSTRAMKLQRCRLLYLLLVLALCCFPSVCVTVATGNSDTTTTTTTTEAPESTSTTTTVAPNGAGKKDGSFGGRAWGWASLVLAAFTLAHATLC
ncbi:uncharacterized protein Tco025E_04024 [Trypanosoma conorhini]|uniref:Uncharacterized protein n=1 Tax=Trypanosoma conorhini TaxID=83891 RepID=A0A3R7MRZ5_9TRYP|nr:uncharacterized protein Tco025E_04024 [Trypanosoma conorhini]RNF19709.1 hypothetical protein Tco025E_04024 [Trypanosoma conorhini]